jgi:hypothetical protein
MALASFTYVMGELARFWTRIVGFPRHYRMRECVDCLPAASEATALTAIR